MPRCDVAARDGGHLVGPGVVDDGEDESVARVSRMDRTRPMRWHPDSRPEHRRTNGRDRDRVGARG